MNTTCTDGQTMRFNKYMHNNMHDNHRIAQTTRLCRNTNTSWRNTTALQKKIFV